MIKLKDLLLEAGRRKSDTTIKTIAVDLLRAVKHLAQRSGPKGLGSVEVAWDSKSDGVFILYDTPREVRHPEDYGVNSSTIEKQQKFHNAVEKWYDFNDEVFKIIQKFEKAYDGIEFGVMGSISGRGLKHSGKPRPSHI